MRSDGCLRRLRFRLLDRVVLPLAIGPIRLWMGSWRRHAPDPQELASLLSRPRLVVATYHGMLLHLLAFAPLCARHGRRLVVLLSPSLDGRLLAAALARFGIGHVLATDGDRGVAGSRELLRHLDAGDVAVIAVDGPLGPCGRVKPGFLRLARMARADVLLALTTASAGLRFGSWDRAHLPLPFGSVTLVTELLPDSDLEAIEWEVGPLAARMEGHARRVESPVLPERRPASGPLSGAPSSGGASRTTARGARG